MPGALSGCQTPGPSDPAGVSARVQLQINHPLLKMKRFMRRAAGHAVPERDTDAEEDASNHDYSTITRLLFLYILMGFKLF